MLSLGLFLLVNSLTAFATEDLYQKYRPAVIKIELQISGKTISHGTGFFVSSKGDFVTTRHLLQQAYRPGYQVKILTSDKQSYVLDRIEPCTRKLDFCYARIQHQPKKWFSIEKRSDLRPGQELWVISHPKGFSYTLSQGIVSAVRGKAGAEEIQFTAPVSPGSSGAPLFNSKGQILGIVTWLEGNDYSQNLNFAVSVNAMAAGMPQATDLHVLSAALANRKQTLYKRYRSWHRQWAVPALKSVSEDLSLPKEFKPLKVTFKGMDYFFPIPKLFKSSACSEIPLADKVIVECEASDESQLRMEIWKGDRKDFNRFLSGSNRSQPTREKLFLVKNGSQVKKWLADEMQSEPEAWQCGQWKALRKMLNQAHFCQRKVSNQQHLGYRSLDTVFYQEKYQTLANMQIIMKEQEALYFYYSVPKIAFGGMKYALSKSKN